MSCCWKTARRPPAVPGSTSFGRRGPGKRELRILPGSKRAQPREAGSVSEQGCRHRQRRGRPRAKERSGRCPRCIRSNRKRPVQSRKTSLADSPRETSLEGGRGRRIPTAMNQRKLFGGTIIVRTTLHKFLLLHFDSSDIRFQTDVLSITRYRFGSNLNLPTRVSELRSGNLEPICLNTDQRSTCTNIQTFNAQRMCHRVGNFEAHLDEARSRGCRDRNSRSVNPQAKLSPSALSDLILHSHPTYHSGLYSMFTLGTGELNGGG